MTATHDAIREVVDRARAGDQVAIAHIVQVREGAKDGDERLKKTRDAINDYIKKHPVSKTNARWGAEASVDTNPRAQLAVWKARDCSPDVFAVIVAKAAPFLRTWDLVAGILHGPLMTVDAPLVQTVNEKDSRVGQCVRKAAQLQLIAANPTIPISTYCRVTGVELGE